MNESRPLSTNHREHITSHVCSKHCISWTAIIIGSIVAIGLSFLLNLLAIGIGLTAFPESTDGQTAFAIGGFVSLVIIAIITMFPAGWVSGFLGRAYCLKRKMGELYGFSAWGLALILTMLLASHVGQFLSHTNYLINRNLTTIKITDEVNGVDYDTQRKREVIPNTKVNTKEAQDAVGIATFVTFFIFFIGMLSATFGGRLGMTYRKRDALVNHNCPQCR